MTSVFDVSTLVMFLLVIYLSLHFSFGVGRMVVDGSIPDLEDCSSSPEICTSPECVVAAATLLETMDLTVDPCEDFYQFACARWSDVHVRSADEGSSDWFSDKQKLVDSRLLQLLSHVNSSKPAGEQLRQLFATCSEDRNDSSLHELRNFLDQYGGWPMLDPNWEPSGSWELLAPLSIRGRGSPSFVDISVDIDSEDTTQYLIQVSQPSLPLPVAILRDRHTYSAIFSSYRQLIIDVVEYIHSQSAPSTTTKSDRTIDVHHQADLLVNFTIQLAEISSLPEQLRDPTSLYHPLSLNELQQISHQVAPHSVNWTRLFEAMWSLSKEERSEGGSKPHVVELSANLSVNVVQPDFIRKLTRLISRTDHKTIINYIMWDILFSSSDHLSSYIRNRFAEFNSLLTGSESPTSLERVCVSWLSANLHEPVDYLYIEKYFSSAEKQQAREAAALILAALTAELSSTSWMDPGTSSQAVEKARAIRLLTGYSQWERNATKINNKYRFLNISDSHWENYIRLNEFLFLDSLSKLSKTVDKNRFQMPVTMVNAMYIPNLNAINIPASILQPPFFYLNIPVLSFGSSGVVIGHELTHGFDDFGRHFDKNGALKEWWSPSTSASFAEKSQCMIDQYNSYNFSLANPDTIMHVNGKNTLGENIADNGGIRQAYKAYFNNRNVFNAGRNLTLPGLENFSEEQLFFISFAQMWCSSNTNSYLRSQLMNDEHSPTSVRVTASVSNTPQFASAFHCTPGTAMNPVDTRCRVW